MQAKESLPEKKVVRDGGVASNNKVPQLHLLRTRFDSSLEHA